MYNMAKTLEAGEYTLPEGYTIERVGSFVTVRPIVKAITSPRCRDCKHCASGRATANGWTTTVCLLQPKGRVDKDGIPLYYHRGTRNQPCEKFEEK